MFDGLERGEQGGEGLGQEGKGLVLELPEGHTVLRVFLLVAG